MNALVPWMAWSGFGLALTAATAFGATPPASAREHPTSAPSRAVPAAQQTPPAADDPWPSPDIAAPPVDPRPLPRAASPRRAAATAQPDTVGPISNPSAGWVRTTLALGGVVGLILLLAWGYRRMATGTSLGRALRPRGTPLIEVVSRAALGPRQSVCLVRVGPRLVLLGCTPDAVRALDVIHDADLAARLLGQATAQRPDSHTAEFARCLEREAGTYPRATDDRGDEQLTPDEPRLDAVRQKLSDTLQRLRTVGTAS